MMDGWTHMGVFGFGLGHWFVFAIMVVVILYPIGRIHRRTGFSPFWSIAALFPLLNLIALWIFAFVDWPERRQ